MTPGETLKDDLRRLRIERAPSAEPEPPRRRTAALLAIAAVLAALGALAYRALVDRPLEVAVVHARRAGEGRPVGAVLSGSGYLVTGEKYILVGVRVPGRVERYEVDEGDHVEPGQVLVRLDDRDYRAQVGRAEAALRIAEANRTLADAQHGRARRLFAEGVLSRDELDQAVSRRDVAAASVADAESQLRQARVNLEDTVLRSPVGGVVLAKLKGVGEIAVPGGFSGAGDLLRLADLSELRAEVDVAEADLARVSRGQSAEVTPDAYPERRYRAAVVKIYPQVNRQKGTLKVEVRIEEPDDRLLPDMSVRVTFLAEPPPAAGDAPAVVAPSAAVRRRGEESWVWVLAGGRLERRGIEAGVRLGDDVEVKRGLDGGEALVVGDESALRPGAAAVIAR